MELVEGCTGVRWGNRASLVRVQKDELEAEVKEEVEHAKEDLDENLLKQVRRAIPLLQSP